MLKAAALPALLTVWNNDADVPSERGLERLGKRVDVGRRRGRRTVVVLETRVQPRGFRREGNRRTVRRTTGFLLPNAMSIDTGTVLQEREEEASVRSIP